MAHEALHLWRAGAALLTAASLATCYACLQHVPVWLCHVGEAKGQGGKVAAILSLETIEHWRFLLWP